ncbi:UDP-glucose--hexose-1-phosphate uridylyltransferase [bacterium]|nr:UDP-glucose--hexose-1-phosphate uridylyltransferase [bacterium]
MIDEAIKKLISYCIENNLVNILDKTFITNRILEAAEISSYTEPAEDYTNVDLEEVLSEISDYAAAHNVIENTKEAKDRLETKIMASVIPMPHEIIDNFKKMYRVTPKRATSWFFKFSNDSNRVKKSIITNDIRWAVSSKYGRFDLTINMTKPECANFDPTDEEAVKYPKCLICAENEGYAGREGYPAGHNIRNIPITVNNENWFFTYSPYFYFNEHCIAFNSEHKPMEINKDTITKLFEFINIFPHYFVGANADLPIIGGGILSHEHFQGGNQELAIARASVEKYYTLKRFEDVQIGILNWPVSTIRLRYRDYTKLIKCADHIVSRWKSYTDESVNIYDRIGGVSHNSVTLVARKTGDLYEMDIVLRNNMTTQEFPDGLYHTYPQYQHIKKGNIGLMEVLGLAILPARLKEELDLIAHKILNGEDLRADEKTAKHAAWVESFLLEYDDISDDNIMEIIQTETGHEFIKMLECAAVFKRDEQGQAAFARFMASLNS